MIISFQKIVLKQCYENDLLTTNNPKWAHWKNDTMSFVEGLQPYDVHESRDPAM